MQIKEGAGLEDSRINTEFVDFLRKWSTPVLLVLCGLSVAYFLYTRQQQAADARTNAAFMEFELTMGSGRPSPTALEDIARRYADVASVGLLSRLYAGDERLRTAIAGLEPTALRDPETGRFPDDQRLTDEAKASFLRAAEADYRWVLERAGTSGDRVLLSISALYGLASIAEMRQEADAARGFYERIIEIAERAKYPAHTIAARNRIATIDSVLAQGGLISAADLPPRPMVGAVEAEGRFRDPIFVPPAQDPSEFNLGPVIDWDLDWDDAPLPDPVEPGGEPTPDDPGSR